MKTNFYKPFFILVALILVLSCTSDETKNNSTTQVARRPSIPITVSEVQIGTQIWMTKNLNVSHYRNGDIIPEVTDPTQWRDITTGAWCYYNNDTANGTIYGKLYNSYAVTDSRGLVPMGWHIPSQPELELLITYLGGSVVAGGKLKSKTGWQSPNSGATNSTGFTGLPAGSRWYNNFLAGGSSNVGTKGDFWSSTILWPTYAYRLNLVEYGASANTIQTYRNTGCSIRCVKD